MECLSASFYVLLAIFLLLGSFLIFNWCNLNPILRGASALAVIGLVLGFIVLAHFRQLSEWEATSFSGEVISRASTDDHGRVEYLIRSEDGEVTRVLDTLWEMSDAKIGDIVEKRKGVKEVNVERE